MDDILSGGRIDESTSGPTPPSRDDRGRDILSEQEERQNQDAVGGTQFPPKPQRLPPIPEAPEVAPPLPVIPSFNLNISGSALEEFREISRQTTIDILKNVNINGQGPSIDGSAISFNIPQQPPASEAFIFQGIMVPQPLPQIQPFQALTLSQPPQIEPAQEIQSIVVAPPSRRSDQQEVVPTVPQNNQLATTIETTGEETIGNVLEQPILNIPIIEQPTQTTEDQFIRTTVTPPQPSASESFMFQNGEAVQAGPPTVIPPPPPQPTEDVQTVVVSPPNRTREEPESISEQRERENTERDAGDQEIRVSLGLDPVSPLDQPSETVTTREPSISEQNDEENATRAQRDADVRASAGLEGEDPMDEESSSAQAYQRAEARRDERRENDPDFNRESGIRQKGETPTEFKERQEQLKQEKVERAEREEKMARVRDGDLTEMPSGMIPVRFTRADGNKKILALIASEFVGVVEGASGGDRPATLPSEDSFYEGGDSCVGLALYAKTVGENTQVWIGAGTVAGNLPSGFDPEEGGYIASGGSGYAWAEVNIDQTTGDITSVAVAGGGSTPNNTDTSFYYTLGYYEYDGASASVTNYGCGSIDVTVCRNWFAAEAPFYGVTMTRCGCSSGGGGGGGGSDFN